MSEKERRGGEHCEQGRERGGGRALGMRRERGHMHGLDCEMIGMRAQVVRVARKHRVGTRIWNEL